MTDVSSAAAAPPEEKRSNPFSRIAGVFFSPSQTFADIARRPDWVVPVLVLLVVSYGAIFVMANKVDFTAAMRESMEQQHLSPDQQERAMRIGGVVAKSILYIAPFLGIGGLVIAAALLFLGLRMVGGQLTFLQSMAVTAYAWMPHALAGILAIVIGMTKKTITPEEMQYLVHSNPAFLVHMKDNPILFNFLTGMDLFSIWVIILLTIGFSIAARVSKVKAFAVVFTLWAVYILFKVGQGALAAMRMRAS